MLLHYVLTRNLVFGWRTAAPSASNISYGNGWKLRLLCAGHSLGGALAQLAAHDIARTVQQCGKIVRVGCYTYGSPRVGNHAFAREFNQVAFDHGPICTLLLPSQQPWQRLCNAAAPNTGASATRDICLLSLEMTCYGVWLHTPVTMYLRVALLRGVTLPLHEQLCIRLMSC